MGQTTVHCVPCLSPNNSWIGSSTLWPRKTVRIIDGCTLWKCSLKTWIWSLIIVKLWCCCGYSHVFSQYSPANHIAATCLNRTNWGRWLPILSLAVSDALYLSVLAQRGFVWVLLYISVGSWPWDSVIQFLYLFLFVHIVLLLRCYYL